MKRMFYNDHAPITPAIQKELKDRLAPEIERVAAAWGSGYETNYAALSLPADHELCERATALATIKKGLHPRMIILVGIGGSYAGTVGIAQALYGDLHESSFYCADTIDAYALKKIYEQAEQHLLRGERILLIVVSKSGTTTETVANAKLFLALLARYRADSYQEMVVTITDQQSALDEIMSSIGISCLYIPANVGGRFSVFSSVGIFPLAMLNVDVKALLAGADSVRTMCTNRDFSVNDAAFSAAQLYYYYERGMVIYDLFLFALRLQGIGSWYRQLMAESIGKTYNREGEALVVGITPTVSLGSIDLHSMVQLYLAGPNNRVTTFVTIAKQEEDMLIPQDSVLKALVPEVNGKKVTMIMDAIVHGTQKAYEFQKRPFNSYVFPELSAYYIGQFLQWKMVEIIYLGYLFDINPFDQPQVELYKKETRKILAHE